MSVKASVSMSEQQESFIRAQIARGRYPSASAVIQRGLDLLMSETAKEEAELQALRAFFAERRDGAFEAPEDTQTATADMIARKRAARGL